MDDAMQISGSTAVPAASVVRRLARWCVRHCLAMLLVVVVLKGVFLAWYIPAWQIPDEPAHFQYVQTIVEQRRFPVPHGTTLVLSEEVRAAIAGSEYYALREQDISTSACDPAAGPKRERCVPANAPYNPAAYYNPVYYLVESVPYLLTYRSPIDVRLRAMRTVGALLFSIVVYCSYRFALLMKRRRAFALAVAVLVGFHPMASFVFAGVSNSVLEVTISSVIVLMMAQWLIRPPNARSVTLCSLLIGLGISVKVSIIVFLPLAIGLILINRAALQKNRVVRYIGIVVLSSLILGTSWFIRNAITDQQATAAIELQGHNLNQLPAWLYVVSLPMYRLVSVFRSFWGSFGQWHLDQHATFSSAGFVIIGIVCFIAVVGIGWYLLSRRNADRQERRVVASSLLALLSLEAFFMALFFYYVVKSGYVEFPNQGRYYFILLPALMALLMHGLEAFVPERRRWVARSAAALLMIALFVASVVPAMYRNVPG